MFEIVASRRRRYLGTGELIHELANVSNGCIACGAADRRFGTAARGVRRGPASAATALPPLEWADWVEPDFPFFSSVVDARAAGLGHADNLSPRALVLNLGYGCWAAFDTDLLRVAAIWNGRGLSANALAPGSYLRPDKKTPGGQTPAPEPLGSVWVANGIYPGWQLGERPSFSDPREPAPTVAEVGRGPIPESLGRFEASPAAVERRQPRYLVGRTAVTESITARAAHNRRRTASDGHAPFQDCRVRRAARRRAGQQGRRYRHRPVAGYRAVGRHNARAVLG